MCRSHIQVLAPIKMTGILDSFLSVFYYWMFPSFGIGIIGFGFLFYVRWAKPAKRKKPLITGSILLGQTVLTWIISFGSLFLVQDMARNELKEILSHTDLSIKINGELIDKEYSTLIISELQLISDITAHHTHPTEKREIQITSNNETSRLSLERDSEIKTEYWIYWDKYKTTKSNEVGRIRTDKLK